MDAGQTVALHAVTLAKLSSARSDSPFAGAAYPWPVRPVRKLPHPRPASPKLLNGLPKTDSLSPTFYYFFPQPVFHRFICLRFLETRSNVIGENVLGIIRRLFT